MTWTKLGSEFSNEAAAVGLSDCAYRTHVEAIQFIYDVQATDCRIAKAIVRRFAGSDDYQRAVKELVDQGWWVDAGSHWQVRHHEDVIRQSLAAQTKKRERDKAAQRRARAKEQGEDNTSGTSNVSADVSADVSGDADRQTDKHLGGQVPRDTCQHGVRTQFWKCDDCESREKTA